MWQITRSANKNYSHKNDLKLVAGIGKFLLLKNGKRKSMYQTLIILIPYLTTIQLDHGSLAND